MPSVSREKEVPRLLFWADEDPISDAARDEINAAGISFKEMPVSDGPAAELFYGEVDLIDLPGHGDSFWPGYHGVIMAIQFIEKRREEVANTNQ